MIRTQGGAIGGPLIAGNLEGPDGGRQTSSDEFDLIGEACSNARLLVTICDLIDGIKAADHHAHHDPEPYFWEL